MQWLCALLVACVAQAATVHSFFEPHAGGFLAQTPSYSVVIAANHAVIQAGGTAVDMHFAGSQRASLSGIGSAQVRGRGLYPGVDILYYANQDHLEYDFVASSGANLSRIRLRFTGANNIRIDEHGDLVLDTSSGELRQKRPRIYQGGTPIDGHYQLSRDGEVSLVLAHYDTARPLVVDPEIVYAARLPGNPAMVNGIALDSQGNIYVANNTTGAGVTKLDPTGQNVLYSTNVAGTGSIATAIALDAAGNAYVTGTASTAFPVTAGAVQESATGAFIAKLSPTGSLVYAANVADTLTRPATIAVDTEGSAYITGSSFGNLPVTPGAYQSTLPPELLGIFASIPSDAFVLKLNAAGTSLVYATYANESIYSLLIEGPAPPLGNGIAVDTAGNAYITGPVVVLKFNPAGTGLVYKSTTDPWGAAYTGNAITIDSAGNAYVAGLTNYGHAFVTKLDASGHSYFNTGNGLLGGEQSESAAAIAVDAAGDVFTGGYTTSLAFPLHSPVQESFNQQDTGFLAEVDPKGHLLFSTYVGDTQLFQVSGLALDPSGKPVICGNTFVTPPSAPQAYPYPGQSLGAWIASYDPSSVTALRLDSLYNLASQLGSPVSAGEIVSINGAGFGSDLQLYFDGTAATMIPAKNEAIVPYSLGGRSYTVAYVESGGQKSNSVLVPVAPAWPGIFTVSGSGTGQALAFNADGSQNSASYPAPVGSVVTFYVTGVGQTGLPLSISLGSSPVTTFQTSVGSVNGFPAAVVTVHMTTVEANSEVAPGKAVVQITENGVTSRDGVFIYVAQ